MGIAFWTKTIQKIVFQKLLNISFFENILIVCIFCSILITILPYRQLKFSNLSVVIFIIDYLLYRKIFKDLVSTDIQRFGIFVSASQFQWPKSSNFFHKKSRARIFWWITLYKEASSLSMTSLCPGVVHFRFATVFCLQMMKNILPPLCFFFKKSETLLLIICCRLESVFFVFLLLIFSIINVCYVFEFHFHGFLNLYADRRVSFKTCKIY